ncbi:response regulator [Smaragdicoccus niigatensis]|uniref:response regulator n=1 Tax=Smaragdicoccus niigatensis TaxID=359359 RepID=UPI000362B762|nr:response regulator [Smaragdicoccus niigatensis]
MDDALSQLALECAQKTTVSEILSAALPLLQRLTGGGAIRWTSDPDPGHTLPGNAGTLVLSADETAQLTPGLAILDNAIARAQAQATLADVEERMNNAQSLANMGDYDWHIASNTNRWSDQLYRIYGQEPQSFNASYDRFLSFIHPDDRERIQAIHQQAYATGEPYEMVERIVREDGRVRYLASNGQVLHDATGTPERMRGTCIDITDRVRAEETFRSLVESSPDAILVVDHAGSILEVNGHASTLLGEPLIGRTVAELRLVAGEGVATFTVTGDPLRLDVTTANLSDVGEGCRRAMFLRDATSRIEREQLAAQLREVQVRRRQALEVNDNIVQGLVAAVLAMNHNPGMAKSYMETTLAAARRLMDDWLEPLSGEDLRPGDLIRRSPSTLVVEQAAPTRIPSPCPRILIVDDNGVVRNLMRLEIESLHKYEVVGEAADGEEAIARTIALKPDVVLLDLAMPMMDGLQALPLIRAASPGVRVIVLSGFDSRSMAEKALAAGADRYLEKGFEMDLGIVIDEVLGAP